MRSTTKFLTWASILMIAGLFSCANEMDAFDESFTTKTEEVHGKHHIPLSDALARLESMLEAMNEEGQTRALQRGNWSVQRVPMSTFKTQTRSDNEDLSADALYVVNFEDNGGYAILSADDRLPDDVIAVTSSGGMIFEPVTFDESTDTITLEMLYVAEDDDYLLGGGNNDIIQDLVTGYVIGWTDSLPGMEDEFGDLPFLPPGGDDDDDDDGGIGGPGTYNVTTSYETAVLYDKKLQTNWNQRSPYNDHCPNRYYFYGFLGIKYSSIREYDFDPIAEWGDDYIDSMDLLAGCVAIATAQILAYNNYPAVSTLISGEEELMSWSEIINGNKDERHKRHLAKLVHNVGVGCDMTYGFMRTNKSFATPAAAKRYLESLKYENVRQYNDLLCVDRDIIIEQLENDCPVFIGAISGIANGHAWVIDGYEKVNKIITTTTSTGIPLTEYIDQTYHYVHCNWGWTGGANNGWFTCGLFDINEGHSYDNNERNTLDRNFDHLFRLITYNKPTIEQ